MKVLPTNFYTIPEFAKTVMDKKDLKELLLETSGWIVANGQIWDIKNRHLGAGVYEVVLQRRIYK